MLCQKCGLKEAVVHVVCVVNDKQIDKWLCSDCVEELAPSNFLSGTVFNAKEFLDGLLKPKAREEQIMNRFTERAKGILEDAMRFALDKGHDHVGTEHILLALLNVENCFAKKILEKLGIDNQAVIKELESWMEPAGSTELMISYTPRAKRALELAGEAAAAFKLHYVGSEHLLLGLLREGEGVAAQVLRRFNVTAEQVMKVIKAVYDNQPLTDGNYNAGDSDVETKSNVLEMLSEFGRNLNQLASDGKIDPVVGREKEVERIIQILCRRTKNNPVLIGESGVGKTAIAEGLAQRIVKGDVPENLKDRTVFPVLCGAADSGIGTEAVLQAIVDYVPNPAEVGEVATADGGKLAIDPNGPVCAFVFKTISDQFGKYSFIKVLSGKAKEVSVLTYVISALFLVKFFAVV